MEAVLRNSPCIGTIEEFEENKLSMRKNIDNFFYSSHIYKQSCLLFGRNFLIIMLPQTLDYILVLHT